MDSKYPDLHKFSKTRGIAPEKLIEAFEIEKIFHHEILKEESFEKRQKLYQDVYKTVHTIYGKNKTNIEQGENPKDNVVRQFRKELEGKSILDVGCGQGYFLASVAKQLKHKELVGLDVSIPPLTKDYEEIEFLSENIVKFDIGRQFDVVFSDQVLEHIAPSDLNMHLSSIHSSLKSDGLFITNLPNRLFGPADVTRIVDFSYSGKTEPQGTHLNESTYGELLPILKENGFEDFKTILPIPKLKLLLADFRIRPSTMQSLENSPLMLNILRRIKFRGRHPGRFGITLICRKK